MTIVLKVIAGCVFIWFTFYMLPPWQDPMIMALPAYVRAMLLWSHSSLLIIGGVLIIVAIRDEERR